MVFRRQLPGQTTVVAVNFTDADAAAPFAFPVTGAWTDGLDGARIQVTSTDERMLMVPSNYGQVWTT